MENGKTPYLSKYLTKKYPQSLNQVKLHRTSIISYTYTYIYIYIYKAGNGVLRHQLVSNHPHPGVTSVVVIIRATYLQIGHCSLNRIQPSRQWEWKTCLHGVTI